MNEDNIKEVVREVIQETGLLKVLEELKEGVKRLEEELTRGRSKQFDKARDFIIDNEIVSRHELTANFKSFSNSYYSDRFKIYAKGWNIETISLPTRGRPEIFIHCNPDSVLHKFFKAWDTEGNVKRGILKNNFTNEEWKEIKKFVAEKIRPIFPQIYIDDTLISWRRG